MRPPDSQPGDQIGQASHPARSAVAPVSFGGLRRKWCRIGSRRADRGRDAGWHMKSTIDRAEADPSREVWLSDSELKGFGLRVSPSGRKSFSLICRTHSGRQRKFSIGRFGALTVQQARDIAKGHLYTLARGEDPAQVRERARAARSRSASGRRRNRMWRHARETRLAGISSRHHRLD